MLLQEVIPPALELPGGWHREGFFFGQMATGYPKKHQKTLLVKGKLSPKNLWSCLSFCLVFGDDWLNWGVDSKLGS